MKRIASRLQVRHFRLIQAIFDSGQLSEAADRLSMTQPAASRTLAEAERIAGQTLFERHPKGMKPNSIGIVLCRRAEALLADLDLAEAEIEAVIGGRSGTVRIGAVSGAAIGYALPAIQELKRNAPNVEVQIDVAPSVQLMNGLFEGDLDFILSRVPPGVDSRRLNILHGRVETLSFLVRDDHPLTSKSSVGLQDLAVLPWIMQSRGMPIRASVEAAYIEAGLDLPIDIIESSSLIVTLAYLTSSHAVSPVAREVSEMLSRPKLGGVQELKTRGTITLSPYHLIRQKERQLSPVVDQLLKLVHAKISA